VPEASGSVFLRFYFLLRNRTRIPVLAAYFLPRLRALAGILLFYYRLSSFAYLGASLGYLQLAFQPGRDADSFTAE